MAVAGGEVATEDGGTSDVGVVEGTVELDGTGRGAPLLVVDRQPVVAIAARASTARAAIAGFFMLPLLLPELRKIPQTDNHIQAGPTGFAFPSARA
jgi:hypothetical protein